MKDQKAVRIAYPGGKALLASKILSFAPKSGRKFIDLFGGRGNLLFHAIQNGFHYDEWIINDIQTARFFRAIKEHGLTFTASEKTKENFYRLRKLNAQDDPHAIMMEPFVTFNGGSYCIQGFKGREGGTRNPESYTQTIRCAAQVLNERDVRILQLDWLECLRQETPDHRDYVAVDVPYINCDTDAYTPETVSHVELIQQLCHAPYAWTFCEYDQPIYTAEFGEPVWRIPVQLRSNVVRLRAKKRIECLWVHKPDPSVTVTLQPLPDYTKLSVPKLLEEIKTAMGGITYGRTQMNREMRERLLPALLELRKKTFRKKPGYYECLKKLGLNGDLVRQWFHRSHTAEEVIGDLEETQPQIHVPESRVASPSEMLLQHAKRMAEAILQGKIAYAKKLATEFRSAWNDLHHEHI